MEWDPGKRKPDGGIGLLAAGCFLFASGGQRETYRYGEDRAGSDMVLIKGTAKEEKDGKNVAGDLRWWQD